MKLKPFYHITIKELVEMKKICKMTIRDAIPKMQEIKAKHDFTDTETKNLLIIARDF